MSSYNVVSDSGITTKIVRRIEQIPLDDWDSVFPKALENYYFFKTLDESSFPQFSFFYIMVYDSGRPIGATSCFLMDFPVDTAASGIAKKITDFIRRFTGNLLNPKILMCGLPMGQGRIGLDGQPEKVVQAVYGAMEELADKEKAQIVAFKDFNSDYRPVLDGLLDKSFIRMGSLPSTDMKVSFSSFEDYLKSLSGISRSGLRRKFKEIDGKVKFDLEVKNRLSDEELEQVYGLFLQTREKQELKFEDLPKSFFKNISNNMPDETKFFLWRMDRKLVSFAFCLAKEGYFIDYYLGFDYSLSYKYHIYFQRFRDLLQWCIDNKMKTYEMGQTGYEPKRRLGLKFSPLYIYAKHRNRLINPFFKVFCRLLQPSNFHEVVKEPS